MTATITPRSSRWPEIRLCLEELLTYVEHRDRSEWFAQINGWKKRFPFRYLDDSKLIKPQSVIEKISRQIRGEATIATVGSSAATSYTPGRGTLRRSPVPSPTLYRRPVKMLLKANDKLVMIGDSITDAGRTQPYGEGLFEPYGKGYVNLVNALLGAVYPELMVRIVNVGTSGHTTRDLKARWGRDVLDLKPQWVSCMIGTNDVWRQFDMPWQKEVHVLPDEYRANLDELVGQTIGKVQGMVLLTPFYIEPNRNDGMRCQMDRYGQIVKEIAAKHKTLFVDTQAAFDRVLRQYYPATLAWDRVHPSSIGHMVLAKAFLDALDFQWK